MGDFKLDTSGYVQNLAATGVDRLGWHDLSPSVQGYVEALFDEMSPDCRFFSALAPETLARIIEDCRRDQHQGLRMGGLEDRRTAKAGAAYWREHQSGNLFDDPPRTVSLGDDGKIYLRDTSQSEGVQS